MDNNTIIKYETSHDLHKTTRLVSVIAYIKYILNASSTVRIIFGQKYIRVESKYDVYVEFKIPSQEIMEYILNYVR